MTSEDSNISSAVSLIGTVLDERFFIERELGRGGVGVVYLARHRNLHDKPVVVKLLLEKFARDEWVLVKFKQEKEALSRVNHPGVVGILDYGELPDGKPYIVMQYIEGLPLRDLIQAEPTGMDFERIAVIVKQIGAALNAVHQKDIFHRDLKPENIMIQRLDEGEQVKIVDFGIAKVKESAIAPSTVTAAVTAGTINYMSPEQLRAERVTSASDIYSFGVVAYEMITGRRPFNPDTVVHLAEMQREGVQARPASLRPRLPQEAESLILQALTFDPGDRLKSASEFGDRLAAALTGANSKGSSEPQGIRSDDPQQPTVLHTAVTERRPVAAAPKQQSSKSSRRWLTRIGALAAALILAVIGVFAILSVTRAERIVNYSLTVQKMRDGKPYEEPFPSSGQEIYETGYKFRLNISSPQSGYLYVFNEGAEENGSLSFNIIYPTPATNSGSAKVNENEPVRTNWNTFAGQAGTEEFWIIWSASPVNQLEAARDAAFKDGQGALTDAAMTRAVKEFLKAHSDPKPQIVKDKLKQQTDVRTKGELLVTLLDLEHR